MSKSFKKFLRCTIDPYGFIGTYDPLFGELISSAICVVWGLWFIIPVTDIFNNLVSFDFFRQFIAEAMYGVYFLIFGLLQFIGYRSNKYSIRLASNMVITAGWVFTTIGLIMGSFHISAVLPLSSCISIGELLLFVSMVKRQSNIQARKN